MAIILIAVFLTVNVTLQQQESRSRAATGNLVANPGFEGGSLSGWENWGNANITSNNVHSGSYALRVGSSQGGVGQRIPDSGAPKTYLLSGWGRVSSYNDSGYLGLDFYNSYGNKISESEIEFSSTSYTFQQKTITVPSNTSYVEVYVWKDSSGSYSSSNYVYMDDISLTDSSSIQPTSLQYNPGSSGSTLSVTSLSLFDARNNTVIANIVDGGTIDVSSVGTSCLNVKANTYPSTVGSVKFAYDGNSSYRTENDAPYFLGSNNDYDKPNCMSIPLGTHSITATPYSGSGTRGQAFSAAFTLSNQPPVPTDTPTPIPTATPVPTNTPTPVPATPIPPTPTNAPTATPAPTNTPMPTPTPEEGSNIMSFDIFFHGIGRGGDSASPGSLGNQNPIHPQRTISIEVYDTQNQLVLTKEGLLTFNSLRGDFQGAVDLGVTVPDGFYTVKVKSNQYLKTLIPGIQQIKPGERDLMLPEASMVTGDINNDNKIDILDYNILMGCYSDMLPPQSCDVAGAAASDLTDDSNVNQFDYNLFLRELTTRGGQ